MLTLLPAGHSLLVHAKPLPPLPWRCTRFVLDGPQATLENCAGANYALERTALGHSPAATRSSRSVATLSGPNAQRPGPKDAAHCRTASHHQTPYERASSPAGQDLRIHRAPKTFHHGAGGELDLLARLLFGDEADLALAARGLGHRRSPRPRNQRCRLCASARHHRYLHRRRTTARPKHVGWTHSETKLVPRYQHAFYPQHLRTVHCLLRRQRGARNVLPARGSALAAVAYGFVRDGPHPVLDRLSQEPFSPRLRLRHYLLPDGDGVHLAHPADDVRDPHPALAAAVIPLKPGKPRTLCPRRTRRSVDYPP